MIENESPLDIGGSGSPFVVTTSNRVAGTSTISLPVHGFHVATRIVDGLGFTAIAS